MSEYDSIPTFIFLKEAFTWWDKFKIIPTWRGKVGTVVS
jgi:hypothetical protein